MSRGDLFLPTSLPAYSGKMDWGDILQKGRTGAMTLLNTAYSLMGCAGRGMHLWHPTRGTNRSSATRDNDSFQPSSHSELFRGSDYSLGPTELPIRALPRLGILPRSNRDPSPRLSEARLQLNSGPSLVRARTELRKDLGPRLGAAGPIRGHVSRTEARSGGPHGDGYTIRPTCKVRLYAWE